MSWEFCDCEECRKQLEHLKPKPREKPDLEIKYIAGMKVVALKTYIPVDFKGHSAEDL